MLAGLAVGWFLLVALEQLRRPLAVPPVLPRRLMVAAVQTHWPRLAHRCVLSSEVGPVGDQQMHQHMVLGVGLCMAVLVAGTVEVTPLLL